MVGRCTPKIEILFENLSMLNIHAILPLNRRMDHAGVTSLRCRFIAAVPPYTCTSLEPPVTQQEQHEAQHILAKVAFGVSQSQNELASATTSDTLHRRHLFRCADGTCKHIFRIDIPTSPDFAFEIVAEHLTHNYSFDKGRALSRPTTYHSHTDNEIHCDRTIFDFIRQCFGNCDTALEGHKLMHKKHTGSFL